MPNEVKPPVSAAASAGTMSKVSSVGSSGMMPRTRMPMSPASMLPSTQFSPASRSVGIPSSTAPFSFPAAARVARPNRVNR